jgi:hypothetical protein
MKIKGLTPNGEIIESDLVKYTGEIPECLESSDCYDDEASLTYIIFKLLERYCEQDNIIDTDLSTIDIACIYESNSDISLPDPITLGNLQEYFATNICALYTKYSELATKYDKLSGLYCANDLVHTDQNIPVTIDVLFNDVTTYDNTAVFVTIDTAPDNGTVTISSNDIIYTPATDYIGKESFIYKVTKGAKTCLGKVSVSVDKVTTNEDIETICTNTIIELLTSDEYWDIGLPIGTKLGISNINVTDFNFLTVGQEGKGKANTHWAKWAICNGKNGTDDFAHLTLRGFDDTNPDGNGNFLTSGQKGGSDTLTINNIPSHRHTGVAAITEDSSEAVSLFSDANNLAGITKMTREGREGAPYGSGSDQQEATVYYNSGDGTDNIDNQGELKSSPDPARNAWSTIIMVQKII